MIRISRRVRRRAAVLLLLPLCVIAITVLAVKGWGSSPAPGESEQGAAPPTSEPADVYPVFSPQQVMELSDTTATHAVLYDVEAGALMFEMNVNRRCYPASLTKIIAAMVVLDHCAPDETVKIGTEIYLAAYDASLAGYKVGTEAKVEELLAGLMLSSGADAAYALAAHVGRKLEGEPGLGRSAAVQRFMEEMNEKAASVGAVDTRFVTPDGYHDANHYTTPADMLSISVNAMRYPALMTLVQRSEITMTARDEAGKDTSVTYRNSNRLVDPDSPYYYAAAIGLKTGYTSQAGDCIAAAAERDGKRLLALVFGCPTAEDRFLYAAKLFDYGFALLTE